ncbi:glycosyltransferase [Flavobacterium ovatum]|uniref:glycosyltransferase n=1 Tax=Flavobacterium ovatum TaxID=1928857 RepID=UPI00344E7E03
MRILQLIDSLEAGGAERMAVSYANALCSQIEFSGLVTTRKEGALASQLDDAAKYLFLNKKSTFDIPALFRLRKFVKKNRITVIHAHSTSFFIAFMLKLIYPSVQLIWHDHYGNSDFLEKRKIAALKIGCYFFDGIVVVNEKLKIWAQKKLHFKNVIYIPNFISINKSIVVKTILKGPSEKRIICLANLREQKNHYLIIDVAIKMKKDYPDWTFHLVGKDFEDSYSSEIKSLISENMLQNTVFIYGTKEDIGNILSQSTIAILSSKSEGLPVVLLEYGLYEKPVVVTAVGEISKLVQNGKNGFVVPSDDVDSFYTALERLVNNRELRYIYGLALHQTIKEEYSEKAVIHQYLEWLKKQEL